MNLLQLKRKILATKQAAGLVYERRKLPRRPFTIISDDCWGGQVYRYHKLPYRTPTVGLQVMHTDYISFIQNIKKPDFLDFREVALGAPYPTIRNPYALLLCVHYETAREAIDTFRRRYNRIEWDNMFYKVDFGAPWYSDTDIQAWNAMALPNSVALTYQDMPKSTRSAGYIRNEVCIDHWRRSGTKMYFASRRYFDFMHFLNTGDLRRSSSLDSAVYKWLTDVWWLSEFIGNSSHSRDFAFALEKQSELSEHAVPPPYAV